jgi:calcineurin-like phosphoesterase family protein
MTTYYGSDIHLGHKNVISFCNRPFKDLEEMQNSFIGEIYSLAEEGDDVYLLGDICFNKVSTTLDLLLDSPATFHLIRGNHDSNSVANHKLWSSVSLLKEIEVPEVDLPIVLCHYPIEDWNRKRYGSIHLHGHTHNNASHDVSTIDNRYDVGYDSQKRWLSTIEQIVLDYKQKAFNYI